jgi:hypothetical protein
MLGNATSVVGGEDYLDFAGIAAPSIRLLPIETHLAEKLHAYTLPRTSGNARVRDLPDMALLATVTDPLLGTRIAEAIQQTFRARGTHDPPRVFPAPPPAWHSSYAALASEQRLRWKTLDELVVAVEAFLDPVLAGTDCGTWDRERWGWSGPT